MTKKEQRTVLAWIDLETTGLDEKGGRILEYAVVCTDVELNEIYHMTAIIPQNVGIAKAMMDEYVVNMHTENGLLAELEAAEGNALQYADSLEAAEENILAMFKAARERVQSRELDTIFVIAGNTVGFDKRWIEEHMPKLFEALHYRQLDVSAYKVGFPQYFGTGTSVAHRAMADIRASIADQDKMRVILDAGLKVLMEQSDFQLSL